MSKPKKKVAKQTPFNDVVARLISERDQSTLLWVAEGLTVHAVEARKVAKRLGVKLPKVKSAPEPVYDPDNVVAPPKYPAKSAEDSNAERPRPPSGGLNL